MWLDEYSANRMEHSIYRRTFLLWEFPYSHWEQEVFDCYTEVIFVQNEQKTFMEQKPFKLHSEYKPTGDQPAAIAELVKGFKEGNQFQTLLGVTGSGKTFTMANVIAALNKPTLVIAHNKTLAGQLYGEFKEFFPENAVEYFVS